MTMTPQEIITKATQKAFALYGDRATGEFYRRLKEHRLSTTRCSRCRHLQFPPRPFCETCFSEEVQWEDLPRRGTLYAFTTQHRALRFAAPDVLGLVDLGEVGRILTRIDAPWENLKIAMPVGLDFVEISGGWVLHQFKPVPS